MNRAARAIFWEEGDTMKILLIGAGMMGKAIAYDLSRRPSLEQIVVADRDPEKARSLCDWIADGRVNPLRLDASAPRAVREAMEDCRVAVSAVPYFLNLGLAHAAVDGGVHFCDLGGNTATVTNELALDREAKEAGVTIIPDCGLAPGLVNLLAMDAMGALDTADSIHIRVGGLPQRPKPPLDYQIVFSPHGLLNEYMEDALIVEGGEAKAVPSLTGWESIAFAPPYDDLEAFHTSGGSSTLPQTLLGRVRELNYKTMRYRGHLEKVKAMADIGFFNQEAVALDESEVVPRELAVRLLDASLSFGEPDIVLLRVVARGEKDKKKLEIVYEMIDNYDEQTGLSAMMRTTGFPISQIAFMLAADRITDRGAIPQELCVPSGEFLEGLQGRGLQIGRREETL